MGVDERIQLVGRLSIHSDNSQKFDNVEKALKIMKETTDRDYLENERINSISKYINLKKAYGISL